jgi:hypothetical protein
LRAELIGNTKMAVHAYTSLGIANPINDKIPEEENIVICQFCVNWIEQTGRCEANYFSKQTLQYFTKYVRKIYLKKFRFLILYSNEENTYMII